MRAIIYSVVLVSACATTAPSSPTAARPGELAEVRHEIAHAIEQQAPVARRDIVKMGHVSSDTAFVFTERTTTQRRVEKWVRHGDGWKLEGTREVDAPAID